MTHGKARDLIECVDKKARPRALGGKQWRAGRNEKGAHCCKGTQSVVALVQVFWWIRLALYRESMRSGTKKQLGAGGRGVKWSTRHLLGLSSWYGQITKVLPEIRRFWFKKHESRLFHTFCVKPNDPNPKCLLIGTSQLSQTGRGQPYTPSFHYRRLFFQSIHV